MIWALPLRYRAMAAIAAGAGADLRGRRDHDQSAARRPGPAAHRPAALNVANFRNRVWKPAVRAADGVPDQMRFYDLRHAFATMLSAGGVPFKEITALLGQSSLGETERYVHRLPDQTLAQRARAAIDHAFPA